MTVTNAGLVNSTGRAGAFSFADNMQITNTGVISSDRFGIEFNAVSTNSSITNSGIASGATGVLAEGTTATITNNGDISGVTFGVNAAGSLTSVYNTGTISGGTSSFSGSTTRDVVFNSGTMSGDVVLEGGDDLYRASGDGQVLGNIRGGAGNDELRGARAADELIGGNGKLNGRQGDDTLEGGNGRDIILGGDGDDEIIGGNAGDLMLGGAGPDVFLFKDTGDVGTTGATRDEIRDFEQGSDVINLAAMVGPDFVFLGTGGFTSGAASELRLVELGGSTFVQFDYDGDASQDGRMLVRGVVDMVQTDFIL